MTLYVYPLSLSVSPSFSLSPQRITVTVTWCTVLLFEYWSYRLHELTVYTSARCGPNQFSIFPDTFLHRWSTFHQFPVIQTCQICLRTLRTVPFNPPTVVWFVDQLIIVGWFFSWSLACIQACKVLPLTLNIICMKIMVSSPASRSF